MFERAHRHRPYDFVWSDCAWVVGVVWVDCVQMVILFVWDCVEKYDGDGVGAVPMCP